MKLISSLCLTIALTSIVFFTKAQDTTATKANVNLPSSLNSTNVQSLIQANASKLQMLGISPTDAQNLANQVLPTLQSGGVTVTPPSQAPQQNNPPANPQQGNPIQTILSNAAGSQDNSDKKPDEIVLPHPTIFGQSFFRDKTISTFNKSTDMEAPDDYILGVGDKLSINIWGYTSYSNSYTIDESGAILPTQTGRIYLKGLAFADAKKVIKGRFASSLDMSNSEMEVTLSYSRVISINIVGEVFEPGTYTMPATNTAFNALIAASGPTNIGSLRKIYIKRAGQTIKTLDVYAFLLDPDSKEDFYLQNNDYIFVPPNTKVVSINGEVVRQNSFELLDNENMLALLKFTGGVTPKAFLNNVIIQRYEGVENKLISLNLDSLLKTKGDFVLKNGDQITINPVPDLIINQIKINGPVTAPGVYSFKTGQKISDVLEKNPLRNDALLNKGYIIRTNDDLTKQYIPFSPSAILQSKSSPDNLLLKNEDVINFFNKSSFKDDLSINVNGAVRNPGDYLFGTGMNLKDALYFAGGLKPEAANNRIEISRIMEIKQGSEITAIPVIVNSISVGKDLTLDEASAGFMLQPSDQVVVRVSSDYDKQSVVNVTGEVQFPGNYVMLDKLERWSSVLKRAGGLNTAAYTEDAYIFRKDESKGIVLSHLDKALLKPNSKYDYILKPGDEIVIPKKTNIVTVTGLVRFPYIDSLKQINVPYTKGRKAKFYIKHFGLGFEKHAKRSRTYVVNPGQNVNGCHKYFLFNCYPKVRDGSTVVATAIPPKELRIKHKGDPINWNQAISTFTVSLTGIATLYILLTKVK
ncbi:MAG: SLBB domain-containing protein [Bacteroidota bacterium]